MPAFSFNPKGSWMSTNSNVHSEVGLREGGNNEIFTFNQILGEYLN